MGSLTPIRSKPRPARQRGPRLAAQTAQARPLAQAAALGLISAASLAFEITLTRIFSLLFQYHYAFLAISLAILGLSLGALLARFGPPPGDRGLQRLSWALALSFPLAGIGLAWLPWAESVWGHTLIALVPFILTGWVSALLFSRYPADSGLLYGADLAGAAAGILGVLAVLGVWGAFSVVLALGVVASLAAFLLIGRSSPRPAASAVLLAVTGGLLAFNLAANRIDFSAARLASASRDKTMLNVLRDPAWSARMVYTAWDPFARVDVVETSDPGSKFVFTDGGAGSYMLRFDGDLASVAGLRETLEYVPFSVSSARRTLILGAGAGKDVVLALLAGSQDITALEVNPAMVAATRHYADYNGGILDRPEVALVVGDARTFVERAHEAFDLIYLNLVYSQAAEPASQALVENYIFTREAFQTYLDRLGPEGYLAIISHNALEGSRAALTALEAMEAGGTPIPAGLSHMALLMLPNDDPTQRTTVLLVGKQPLADETVGQLMLVNRGLGLQPLFLPGQFELLFKPLRDGESLEKFLAADPTYELSPTRDDRPFFFKLDPGLPLPVGQALASAGVLAGALLAVALGSAGGGRYAESRPAEWLGLVAYAALIGLGFMLVEIPLIQRFHLLLGYPVLSLAAVLGTLLLAGGAGSLLSQRWPTASLLGRVSVAAAWIGLLALLYGWLLPRMIDSLLAAPLGWRVAATMALTALLGVPLGIPFPSALRLAGERRHGVALLWGVNGAFSVLGSTLAVALAMTWGFRWALWAGVLAYLLLAGLAWFLAARRGTG